MILPVFCVCLNAGLFSQIRLLDTFVYKQGLARAGHRDDSSLHYVRVIGDVQGRLGVLLDQQDVYAVLFYLLDTREYVLDDKRRESQRRFIEHEELRL